MIGIFERGQPIVRPLPARKIVRKTLTNMDARKAFIITIPAFQTSKTLGILETELLFVTVNYCFPFLKSIYNDVHSIIPYFLVFPMLKRKLQDSSG